MNGLSKTIGLSSARHAATIYAGAKISMGTPVEQLVGALIILVVLISSIVEKVKVKKVMDGYEVTIQDFKALHQERKEKANAEKESCV